MLYESEWPARLFRNFWDQAFSAARILIDRGAVGESVHTLSAILAGGSFATDCLFLVLSEPCDRVLQHNEVSLSLFVDDIALHATGTVGSVAEDLVRATTETIGILEDELGLSVSRSKKPWTLDHKTVKFSGDL